MVHYCISLPQGSMTSCWYLETGHDGVFTAWKSTNFITQGFSFGGCWLLNIYQHATGEKRCSGGRIHRIRQFHRRRPERERRRCGVRDSALRHTPGSAGGLHAHAQYGMRHSGKDRLTRNACLRRQVCFRVWERRRGRYRDNDTHGTPMFSLWVLRLITWFPQP